MNGTSEISKCFIGKVVMRRFRIFLSPIMFVGHAARRAAAHPAVVGAVTVVVLAGGAVSGGAVLANAGASSAAPGPGWPQLHYGPDRTGYQPDETQIGTGNVSQLAQARTYPTTADPSAPLVANGILYVDSGKLYAFDATGSAGCSAAPTACTPLWTAATAYFDGMTVADGDVFVTDAEGVQAFDAAGSKNCSGTPKVCAPLWATSTRSSTGPAFTPGSGSPLVASGVLYVPGYGDGLPLSTGGAYVAAFDVAGSTGCSGSPVVCVPLWTTTGPPASTGNTGSPAIGANGVLYIANQTLYAFDAAGTAGCSGTPKVCAPLWTAATTNSPTYSAPAVANGTVYVGSWGSKLYAFDAGGSVNCSTGAAGKMCTPLWTAATPSSIGGTPAVANGVVYTVSGDGTLSAFDAAGSTNCSGTATAKTCTPLWASARGPNGYVTSSSPAVANGVVYFSSTDGGTYGYDAAGALNCSVSGTAKTCSPLWGAVTGYTGGGSPAIASGVLYINVTGDGTTYAYALPPGGTPSPSPSPTPTPTPTPTPGCVGVPAVGTPDYCVPPDWNAHTTSDGLVQGTEPLNVIISARSTVPLADILSALSRWHEVTTGVPPAVPDGCMSVETADVAGGAQVPQQQSWRLDNCYSGNILSLRGNENHIRVWNQPVPGSTSGAWFITASFETACVQIGSDLTPPPPAPYKAGDFIPAEQERVYALTHRKQATHCIDGSTNSDGTKSSVGSAGYDHGASAFVDDIQAAAENKGWTFTGRTDPRPAGVGLGGVPYIGGVEVVTVDYPS
jgi:outer membrane protein assembly factor BamB